MKIVLTTTNKSKYASLRGLVSSIAKKSKIEIKIAQLPRILYAPPIEDGESAMANCQIKACYYEKYISDPFIVSDDDIDIQNLATIFQSHDFHKLNNTNEKTPKELFKYLQRLVIGKNKYPVKITRHFGCIYQGKKTYFKNIFNGFIYPLNATEYEKILGNKVIGNPLNYFIITLNKRRLFDRNPEERIDVIYTNETKENIKHFLLKISPETGRQI